ncbi:hypothetical protein [Microcella sp.]|uniref:hypothetical protein n=1 Tax=Microcella sp. TaxID=1913979 RepID=UPI003919C5E7
MTGLVTLDDARHDAQGSTIDVRQGDTVRTVRLRALGAASIERALQSLDAAVERGETLDEAIATLVVEQVAHRTEPRRAADGALLLDDTGATAVDDVRASLRVLADLGRSGLRTIAVIGPLAVDERDRFEVHDALGRIIVRLDVRQLVVIGHAARHLHMAAGLEGSWDGESVLMDDLGSAYDFVRATSGADAVILISGGADLDLGDLVERLSGDPS